eukprot:ANDGO_00765.mRNA.1 UDP-xylose and UDP-N-acetylglucosamine transporter
MTKDPAKKSSSVAAATTVSRKSSRPLWVCISLVFLGCCVNVLSLEALVHRDQGAANLISFTQYVFIASITFSTSPRKIPFVHHVGLTLLVFLTGVLNSFAMDLGVSPLLHSIFRSASLVSNLTTGALFFKKKPTMWHVVCVCVITAGVVVAVTPSGSSTTSGSNTSPIAFVLLTISVVISAFQGHMQEWMFKKYGNHSSEVLFYSHLLSIPMYLSLSSNLSTHIRVFMAQPTMFVALFVNVVTQYMCVQGVYLVLSCTNSLTLNVVVTVRKLLSVIISVLVWGNSLGTSQWLGAIAVFAASAWYGFLPKTPAICSISRAKADTQDSTNPRSASASAASTKPRSKTE